MAVLLLNNERPFTFLAPHRSRRAVEDDTKRAATRASDEISFIVKDRQGKAKEEEGEMERGRVELVGRTGGRE
jgi:hypothetical protein